MSDQVANDEDEGTNSTTCKHCGEPIMRFRFKQGREWFHVDFGSGKTYQHCTLAYGKKAKPARRLDDAPAGGDR